MFKEGNIPRPGLRIAATTAMHSSQMYQPYKCSEVSSTSTRATKDSRESRTTRKVEGRNRHKESTIVSPKCARCKNHGVLSPLKGHKGLCKWKECICKNCSLIVERQRIMAAEQSVLKEMAEQRKGESRPNSMEASTSSSISYGRFEIFK